MKPSRITLRLVGTLLLGGVATAGAQQSHIGPHAGYNFDIDRAFAGAQLSLPLGRAVELYPSFDYYFVDAGSLIGLSGDVKFRFPTAAASVLYVGAGVNFQRAAAAGASDTDTGWDFLFGLESRIGLTHPFIEGRVLNHKRSAFQIGAGLNITLF